MPGGGESILNAKLTQNEERQFDPSPRGDGSSGHIRDGVILQKIVIEKTQLRQRSVERSEPGTARSLL